LLFQRWSPSNLEKPGAHRLVTRGLAQGFRDR
jgi:hypothetical protein